MAGLTSRGEISSDMVRVRRLVIIGGMASVTDFRSVGVIALVAVGAGICNGKMCTGNHIVIIMNSESRRFPAWHGSMAGGAFSRYVGRDMIRICRLGVICQVAAVTCGRSSGETIRVALDAVSRGMGAG